jgi:multidrug efflux pump
MAATVAAPLERKLGQIAGVDQITSTSSLGNTSILLQFSIGRNIDRAARDVQAAINASLVDLPSDLPSLPRFRKANPSAAPVFVLALTSKTISTSAMYDVADTVLAQRISQVPGVGEVNVSGADQPAVRIALNPVALSNAATWAYACLGISGALAAVYGYTTANSEAVGLLRALGWGATAFVGGCCPAWLFH